MFRVLSLLSALLRTALRPYNNKTSRPYNYYTFSGEKVLMA